MISRRLGGDDGTSTSAARVTTMILLWVVYWLLAANGCAVPSILPNAALAFTTRPIAFSRKSIANPQNSHEYEYATATTWLVLPLLSSFSKTSPNAQQSLQQVHQLRALPSSFGIDEASATSTILISSSLFSQQPPLDAIGVDPGQALFWSTIVHWILWGIVKNQYLALSFDAICIAITLWDGTVRAAAM